jgi:homocysteine S-methyltransferase
MPRTLPQLERLFLTDGGIETDLIYNRGIDLPFFSSINLLRSAEGREAVEEYFRSYLDLARRLGIGFELVSASWRASPDWAAEFGLTQDELDRLNGESVAMLRDLRSAHPDVTTVITGCIGPRGDGYDPGRIMSAEEAQDYHRRQVFTFASAGADMIGAITITNVPEAIGIARAAKALDVPAYISFTVETDGCLPTGDTLDAAIAAVDEATDGYPSYFMVNCAHPDHFTGALLNGGAAIGRIQGMRANASRCSHAELDAMTELDDGNPEELARMYRQIRESLPGITVLGGCCGTDLRHIAAIADACLEDELALTSAA